MAHGAGDGRTCPGLWVPLQLAEGLSHRAQRPAHGVHQLDHVKLHSTASPAHLLRRLLGQVHSQGGTPVPEGTSD